jgi:protein-disulfide isomerase
VLGAAAAALVGGLVAISIGEGGPGGVEITGVGAVQQLYGGIEQDSAYLGDEDAGVEVVVFNDLQCADCADWQLEVVDPLVEEYARTGEARLELRHFSVGPRATTVAALAAVAAGEQDRQWQYADLFFRNQQQATETGVGEDLLGAVAEGVQQLDEDQWREDRELDSVAERVEADAALAAELRLPADPAIVVTGAAGARELVDAPSLDEVEAAIAAVR